MNVSSPPPSSSSVQRARGRSRGGYGKSVRARGRGHRLGRPAQFTERLVLEDEQNVELDSDEEREQQSKFAKRTLESNVDRYNEHQEEATPGEEPEPEPEVDLSAFLARQRLDDAPSLLTPARTDADDIDDIDTSLAHLTSSKSDARKGKAQSIQWDDSLDQLQREKASAEALWDLKARFRGTPTVTKQKASRYDRSVALQDPNAGPPKDSKEDMEAFLDDLLT
ncbi:hypothetical protein SISSUDRAFT_1022543 [Sistotremastrum suecicum HHB10207 ss-3]|uniref:Uncharacterized protein n=1 Tax=Sistotremastrum suecicum HHB10207 ss-3 TaxID=1314776 RepID=A0A166CQQ3_9AGAM|nr:hypothetical protein SISSUDRAFT_1022543 [Sistotremastrum suecicum HHB10207 ss-3]